MSRKKRIKIKKKRVCLLLGIVLLGTIGILFGMDYLNKNNLGKIKDYYHQYVITNKKTTLYNSEKKAIGTIEKNYPLELEKIDIDNHKEKYFKINNTKYYVVFHDLKKAKNKVDNKEKNQYLVFNQNVKTNKKVILYKNNKKIITLDKGLNTPIQYQDKKNYYVTFLNQIFQVPKNSVKTINKNNTKEKEANYVSVLTYNTISNTCSGYECINNTIATDQINLLKENGYYFISKKEYENYIDGNIHLKEKAILLNTNEENDFVNNLKKDLSVSFEKININENEKVKNYSIKSYTTTDNILKMANGEQVVENPPVINNQAIAVLNYHFFYDATSEVCNESICLDTAKFREHLNYLKENNYKALTMEEFKRWMYGEIELPEKSVLITIDDGAMGTGKHNGNKLIPLLEEYKTNATLFLIAGWWDINNYRSPYLNIQSHTFDMHQYGSCGKGQINCGTLEDAKTDLKKSLDIIGNDDSFCFPFYSYTDTSLQAVKETGFKLAFVGGMKKATRNNNKFLIPRYPIYDNITLQQFISMIS